jgi:hypothetical protein
VAIAIVVDGLLFVILIGFPHGGGVLGEAFKPLVSALCILIAILLPAVAVRSVWRRFDGSNIPSPTLNPDSQEKQSREG